MFKPMIVGALPLGLATGAICYVVVYKSVEVYQHRRRASLARKRAPFPAPHPVDLEEADK